MKKLVLHGMDDVRNIEGRLSFIGIDFSKACNFKCIYCFSSAGMADKNELSKNEKISILSEAKKLGAQSLTVTGLGEPLMDKDFRAVIEYCAQVCLAPVIYTNGSLIDKDMASFMYEHNATPIIKLESLKPEVHDYLTGGKGNHKSAMNAIGNLFSAGYSRKGDITRIGTTTVLVRSNMYDIPAIADWCSERGIKPSFDIMSLTGRAKENEHTLKPTLQDVLNIQKQLDAESLTKKHEACHVWKYGIVIGNRGDATYCPAVTTSIGNIREYSLSELVRRKNEMHPARAGNFTCPVKEPDYVSGSDAK